MSKGILYTYQYDKQGRQIEKWENGKKVLQYQYDKNGNMVCQKDISGKQTEYTFDDVGRIQTVIDDGEKAVQYYYNNDSTLQKICYGNGVTIEYGYDKDQSVVSLMTAKKDGTLIAQNTYAYDENGNQIQKTEKGIKTTYDYDSLNQIKMVVYDEKVTEQFDYDAVGNRIKRTLQDKEENYYYNNKNQLLQIDKENDTIFYKYDNQGNTLEQTSSKGTTTYQYDIYNRTRQVTTENGDIIKNKYDPLGFRYKKEVNGETHKYIFDGWSITAETNKYGELKSREVRGYGLVKKETDNNSYYYHQNEHGDITHLTNTDEEIENSYQYDVFGNMREQQENVENVFKYAGEQQDQETEQYYLRARFYNPVIARFTQEDVYRGDGLNLYVYVVNNPLLWIDPSGHAKCNRLSEEEIRKIQERVDQYKVTDENGNIIESNPYNWEARILQKCIDEIHAAEYGYTEREDTLSNGTTVKKYSYGSDGSRSGGKEPMALTLIKKGKVIVSSNQTKIGDKAKQKAYEIFGKENVEIVEGPGTRFKAVQQPKKDIRKELDEKLKVHKEYSDSNEIKVSENKFKIETHHAEARGIQRGKKLDDIVEAKQFCSHLACPSCQVIQNREKVLNGTGYCEDNNYVYSRDYTHLDK